MRLPLFRFRYVLLFAAIVSAAVGLITWPATALTISPIIVVIEGRNRYADISLVNGGNTMKNYEMGWQFFRMQEGTGKYEPSETATTPFDITQNIVFTPKRVQIAPKGAQKVRLGLRLKGEPPPPGDYRAHLSLREASPQTPAASNEQKGTRVGIKVNVGFTVPVVYRVGEPDVTATIGDVTTRINPETKQIEALVPVALSDSPYGVLGHMYVYYDGAQIGEVGNANIFPEARNRTFTVPLKAGKLSGGSLRVVLMDYKKDKNKMYAQKIIPVGN